MSHDLRVLVVDDERPLVGVISSYLVREGFEVIEAHDGSQAVERAHRFDPGLVLLDLVLPGIDGIETCRQLRDFTDAYVIMLSARDSEDDKVAALQAGADDYIVKPFSPRELVARIRAMLRRPRHRRHPERRRKFGDLTIDNHSRTVTVGGEPIELTRTEFDLLAALTSRPRAAWRRRQLIDEVWGPDWFGDEHVVDVHIAHLRQKLGDDATRPHYIRTVRGVGYGLGVA